MVSPEPGPEERLEMWQYLDFADFWDKWNQNGG